MAADCAARLGPAMPSRAKLESAMQVTGVRRKYGLLPSGRFDLALDRSDALAGDLLKSFFGAPAIYRAACSSTLVAVFSTRTGK